MKVGVLSKSLFLNDNVHGRRRLEKKQFTSEKKKHHHIHQNVYSLIEHYTCITKQI